MPIQKCAVCSREAIEKGDYCVYHGQALEELRKHFSSWNSAYGYPLTWKQYLAAVLERKETGRWVREVADVENKKEG